MGSVLRGPVYKKCREECIGDDMKELNILGVSICEYSVREALKKTEGYLRGGVMNTVLYVSTKMLVEAGRNPEQKKWIESMDMTVCGEPDILRAAGEAPMNRIREIENNVFLKEVMKRIGKERRTVYLLAQSKADMETLKKRLSLAETAAYEPDGTVLESAEWEAEALVNHINDIAPSVIISMIPFPVQEKLMAENKNYINADLWIALTMPKESADVNGHLLDKTMRRFFLSSFRRRVVHYKSKDENTAKP